MRMRTIMRNTNDSGQRATDEATPRTSFLPTATQRSKGVTVRPQNFSLAFAESTQLKQTRSRVLAGQPFRTNEFF